MRGGGVADDPDRLAPGGRTRSPAPRPRCGWRRCGRGRRARPSARPGRCRARRRSARSTASTGQSFSRVSGSCRPTEGTSTRMIEVSSGTVKPACSAIHTGLWPTTAGLSFAPEHAMPSAASAPKSSRSSAAFSVGVAPVGVQRGELGHGRVVDRLVEDDGLLGGADHAVVERLGEHDVVDRAPELGGALDEGRHVAGADAEGGLAAGVGGLDHGVAAGGQDERDVGVVHQRVGHRDRRAARSTGCSARARRRRSPRRGPPARPARSDCCADGWKAKTIGLRVFSAIRLLKIAVEVGLVTGVMPQITPTGSAISTMP